MNNNNFKASRKVLAITGIRSEYDILYPVINFRLAWFYNKKNRKRWI